MSNRRPLQMRLSLDVLQHLGINLYSNVPAVLSEIVANAWDADANRVLVELSRDKKQIRIEDDGIGMTRNEVIDRFLLVGYQRRTRQPGVTPKGRSPMGRKGIGKLSLFSIAGDIVVETVQNGERTSMRMRLGAVQEAIRRNKGEYEPEELPVLDGGIQKGTCITLDDLRKRHTISTAEGLRKRLARRFSIIGPSEGFSVTVNGTEITPSDRGYHDRLQYIWTYGDQSPTLSLCKNLERHEERGPKIPHSDEAGLMINGWLGTVRESGQLKDEFGENLNRIAIFVRGKMAQEDLLNDFAERGIYANYLIGELRVDGLDTATGLDADEDEDSATSSRQRIVEDDPRYVALKEFVNKELKHIQNRWSELRVEDGARTAMEIPEINEWISELPKEISRKAKSWLGKINRLSVGSQNERKQLMKHAVLAFEFHRWNQNLSTLDAIDDENLEAVIAIFQDLDGLESSLYGQIVQQRIEVIRALQEKVDHNAKERVIQSYIFDHLWLLDPSWERVEASEVMEKRVSALFEDLDAKLSREEKNARLDIKYRKTVGKHVIVELKRPERAVSVYDLGRQIQKYRSGMLKILEEMSKTNEPVEFICLLGKAPIEWDNARGKETVEKVLEAHNARYVNYDELLESSFQSYSDYLKSAKVVDKLGKVIRAIENYGE
ncbi:MAG: ATP-binding protein [Gemmatimonadota bacterium]|nr:ATP-binding protein [Gemmatimonadota bacterium]